MKTLTIPGKHYIVRSSTGCTVTQETSPGKYITASVSADEDTPVFAHTGKFDIDDEGAVVTEVFNSAPYQKLRLLGVVGGNDDLPPGYMQVAYLESNGFQWVDTEYQPNYKTTMELDFSMVTTTNVWLFGNGDADKNDQPDRMFSCIITSQGGILFYRGSLALNASSGFVLPAQRDTLLVTPTYAVGGGNRELKYEQGDFVGVTNLILLTHLRQHISCQARLYGCKLSEDDIVYRKFLPAISPSGEPCMFDMVSKTPFLNSGTGAFVAGIETQKQLNAMLRKLPDRTGQDVGTLQVRLTEALQTPENEARLDAMLAKNWEISQAA